MRDFMYVDDIAEGLLLAAEKQNVPQYHLNLSWGLEISIRELVRWIAHLCQFKQDIVFDDSKAGGDVRRVASGRLAREVLGFEPKVGLEEGLIRTINWYRSTL
jgi:nucleoside-diphosphate-sugar epimerase